MLPKVATHIIHTTSRAAAAVHNQTSTFRNVLQLQTSPGPSTSGTTNLGPWNGSGSSGWGNHGPGTGTGAGGAKYNAGSRFYSGFTGPVRAVTQANVVTSQDGTLVQHDDHQEETPTRRVALRASKRTRLRSSSVSLGVSDRHERAEKLGVLKTVQIHARSRHAFAQLPNINDTSRSTDLTSAESTIIPSRPLIVRRNSTSSTTSEAISSPNIFVRRNSTCPTHESSCVDPATIPLPASPQINAVGLPPTDPAAPQTTTTTPLQQADEVEHHSPHPKPSQVEFSPAYLALQAARDSRSPSQVGDAVRTFRQTAEKPSVREFNMALDALVSTRRVGEPLKLVLETYNDMVKHSLLPTLRTYTLLIQALTERDYEVHRSIWTIQARMRRRTSLTGELEVSSVSADEAKLAALQGENNFSSAMALFEAVISINGNSRLSVATYISLLRSCAYHGNVANAIHVFAQLERRADIRIPHIVYKYMIQAYTNAGQIAGAQEIFDEFRQICSKNDKRLSGPAEQTVDGSRLQLMVWNQMIDAYFRAGTPDKAVGLIEFMMGASSPSASATDIPPPASSTFTAILSGFIDMDDVPTALVWFERLLEQQQAPGTDPLAQTHEAIRPDAAAWNVIIEALASRGMVNELNKVFSRLLKDGAADDIRTTPNIRSLVVAANMQRLPSLGSSEAEQTLSYLVSDVLANEDPHWLKRSLMVKVIWSECISRGLFEIGADAVMGYSNGMMQLVRQGAVSASVVGTASAQEQFILFTSKLYEMTKGAVPFELALKLSRFGKTMNLASFDPGYAPYYLHSYGLARRAGAIPNNITEDEWAVLLNAAVQVEAAAIDGRQVFSTVPDYAFQGVISLLEDMKERGIGLDIFREDLVRQMVKVVFLRYDAEELKAVVGRLGPAFQIVLETPESQSQSPTPTLVDEGERTMSSSPTLSEVPVAESVDAVNSVPAGNRVFLDPYLSRMIDELLSRPRSAKEAGEQALKRLMGGLSKGRVPSAVTFGRIVQCLGRAGEQEKAKEVYGIAQNLLDKMEKQWPADSWFMLEDSMIVGLAHAGDIDAAHVHRGRMLERGGAPTADAYGALILHVKDTTDDTSNAMALFQEAQLHNVKPNQYLFNNIISKLAKARKADYALELFHRMKAQRIFPSSITYGAVIGACARVGDVQSAETLFGEMVAARNFKPRVPPYNTMMQLYTTTKPNRERALFYYEKMMEAGVAPSAHTYKLLMDAYGAIEPVDIESMEKVFLTLQRDVSVAIQGTHFASLINAYGCVQKDLDKAISTFNSISTYPRAPAPDAVVFEAMINTLVAHRRTDLMPEYVGKMSEAGVHMTAYIANFLIKGYANVGDLEQARGLFESLVDPPEGVAAPGNHVPHEGAAMASGVNGAGGPMEPVYREPSTWETMIRAELGAGERVRALDLLERLKARKYPEAVYNRISGIMVDHSMVF
ncbi:hypothetical protein AX17_004838 [Amanita inopinata Kibby_2008]|nr:hypothetical protein AX17_004838 [Amanita inopinata Kibby_2008]